MTQIPGSKKPVGNQDKRPQQGQTAAKKQDDGTAPSLWARLRLHLESAGLQFGRVPPESQTGTLAQAQTQAQAQTEARLPAQADPLRRARLQTHLFMTQLSALSNPTASATAAKPKKHHQDDLTETLADLRAQKAARAAQATKAAQAPGRRRAEALNAQRDAAKIRGANPARTLQTKQRPQPKGARAPQARSLGPRLLAGLVVFAALLWLGYRWYQSQDSLREDAVAPLGSADTPADLEGEDGSIAIPVPPVPVDTPVPNAAPDLTPGVTPDATPDPAETAESRTPETPQAPGTLGEFYQPLTDEFFELAAYEDAVLILESMLARTDFLDPDLVDVIYDGKTQAALQRLAATLNVEPLAAEVSTAALRPTRAELERWVDLIKPLAQSQ